MVRSFKTRKRGTAKQIGKKFPVLEKKKLPSKISIKGWKAPFGGDTGVDADYLGRVSLKKLREREEELEQSLRELAPATREEVKDILQELEAVRDEISARETRGGKLSRASKLVKKQKEEIAEEVAKMILDKQIAGQRVHSSDKHNYVSTMTKAITGEAITLTDSERNEIGRLISRKLYFMKKKAKKSPVVKSLAKKLVPPEGYRAGDEEKITPELMSGRLGVSVRKAKKLMAAPKIDYAVVTDEKKMKDKIVVVAGKKYIKPDLSKYSPTTRHFDPIKREYLTLKQSKTAGLIPVVSEEEKKALRILRRDPGVRAEERLKRRRLEDSQYLQYLKDMGVSKKIIDVNRQMMKRQIAEKIRVVKYPVEKRGPSYQRYLQKLRDKRAAEKAGKLKR